MTFEGMNKFALITNAFIVYGSINKDAALFDINNSTNLTKLG